MKAVVRRLDINFLAHVLLPHIVVDAVVNEGDENNYCLLGEDVHLGKLGGIVV